MSPEQQKKDLVLFKYDVSINLDDAITRRHFLQVQNNKESFFH